MSAYEEFRIDIDPNPDGKFSVRMCNALGQEDRTTVTLPFGDSNYIALMNAVKQRMPLAEKDSSSLGRLVYQTLFTDARLWAMFLTSKNQAEADGKRLRIVFAIDPASKEAASFPWEFACDDVGIPLVNEHSLVRYIPRVNPLPPIKVDRPLTMLLAWALPTELNAPLDIEAERQAIRAALKPMEDRGDLQVIELPNLTGRDLQRAVSRQKIHIFHFIGHGVVKDGVGHLVLDNGSGGRSDFSAQKLATLFAPTPIRLVILNACKTSMVTAELLQSMAPALLGANVPAVVAMQSAIRDSAGRVFAEEFYYHLGEGFPIDLCVAEGRRAMLFDADSSIDWGLVTLYMRAKDGILFDQPSKTPPDESQSQPQPASDGNSSSVHFGSNNTINGVNVSMGNVGTTVQHGGGSNAAGNPQSSSHMSDLERYTNLLQNVKNRLYDLELKAAKYGPLRVPYDITVEISETKQEVAKLEARIRELGG